MLLARNRVMSIPEFLQECRVEDNITKLDRMIGHIKRNKKVYQRLVVMIAITLFAINFDISVYAIGVDVDEAIGKINRITDQLLKLVQVVGSSANLILVFKGVITEIFRGNGNIAKPVLNYIWIQLVLYFLPTLGDIISSIATN